MKKKIINGLIVIILLNLMQSCCFFYFHKRVKDQSRFEFVKFFIENPELQDSIVNNNNSQSLNSDKNYLKVIKNATIKYFYCGFDFVDDEELFGRCKDEKDSPFTCKYQSITIRSKCVKNIQDLIFTFKFSEENNKWNLIWIQFSDDLD